MRYIDVYWKHSSKNEPIRLVSEIDNNNFEIRKLEFFPDGSVDFASKSHVSKNTKLGIVEVPSISEINAQPEFEGEEITFEIFDQMWKQYVNIEL